MVVNSDVAMPLPPDTKTIPTSHPRLPKKSSTFRSTSLSTDRYRFDDNILELLELCSQIRQNDQDWIERRKRGEELLDSMPEPDYPPDNAVFAYGRSSTSTAATRKGKSRSVSLSVSIPKEREKVLQGNNNNMSSSSISGLSTMWSPVSVIPVSCFPTMAKSVDVVDNQSQDQDDQDEQQQQQQKHSSISPMTATSFASMTSMGSLHNEIQNQNQVINHEQEIGHNIQAVDQKESDHNMQAIDQKESSHNIQDQYQQSPRDEVIFQDSALPRSSSSVSTISSSDSLLNDDYNDWSNISQDINPPTSTSTFLPSTISSGIRSVLLNARSFLHYNNDDTFIEPESNDESGWGDYLPMPLPSPLPVPFSLGLVGGGGGGGNIRGVNGVVTTAVNAILKTGEQFTEMLLAIQRDDVARMKKDDDFVLGKDEDLGLEADGRREYDGCSDVYIGKGEKKVCGVNVEVYVTKVRHRRGSRGMVEVGDEEIVFY
ncbi:hypothetical protein HDU76_011868 [Blyttiomyces sp. JEL0837]|nr:hypothetical protein HDU76_011868 [Blyttiomyces sp. JEL0837]